MESAKLRDEMGLVGERLRLRYPHPAGGMDYYPKGTSRSCRGSFNSAGSSAPPRLALRIAKAHIMAHFSHKAFQPSNT